MTKRIRMPSTKHEVQAVRFVWHIRHRIRHPPGLTTYVFDPAHTALVIIDMQRDFVEPGGFGAALGNDVRRLQPAVPAVASLLAAFRKQGLTVSTRRSATRPTWPTVRPPSALAAMRRCGSATRDRWDGS